MMMRSLKSNKLLHRINFNEFLNEYEVVDFIRSFLLVYFGFCQLPFVCFLSLATSDLSADNSLSGPKLYNN